MKETAVKFLREVAFPKIKADTRNRNKGLIPRFHQDISDAFFGGTKTSLAKVCSELANEGILKKAFVKFNPSSNDILGEADERGIREITEGNHKGMKVGRDGRLSTPIYWFVDDTDIPEWATRSRADNFRMGEEWFKNQGGTFIPAPNNEEAM